MSRPSLSARENSRPCRDRPVEGGEEGKLGDQEGASVTTGTVVGGLESSGEEGRECDQLGRRDCGEYCRESVRTKEGNNGEEEDV